MLYPTCTTITSVDFAHYGVSEDCGTSCCCSMADGISFDVSLSLNCIDLYKRGRGA